MFAHIVPKVYQKSWHSANGKNNVLYFNKDNIDQPINNQGGNIGKNLGDEDEYIITKEDNENGLMISPDNSDKIEKFFANGIEQEWNNILTSNMFEWLNNVTRTPGAIIGIKAKDVENTPFKKVLLDFMILQNLRIFENFMEFDNGNIDFILNYLYESSCEKHCAPPKEEFDKLLSDENYKKSIWKSILKDCIDKNDSFLVLLRDRLFAHYNLTFFYLKEDIKSKFILSDNPVIWNCSTIRKYQELENGIFFPIAPYCLAAYLNYGRNDIVSGDVLCVYPKDQFVKYINYLLLKQSREQIGFMHKNVKDHISNKFDKKTDWDIMFQ